MRIRNPACVGFALCALLVGGAALSPGIAATETASLRATPVLGARTFAAPFGAGWGTAHPRRVDNGGVPSGIVFGMNWRHWGAAQALGRGRTYLYKPAGGYFQRPGRILLRARRLGSCGNGRSAYTRLRFRVARRPRGPIVGPWRSWASGSGNICR